MDAQTFDRLTAAMARRPSRRATLRLLAGGLLGGLFAQRGVIPTAAQDGRPDRDGDGLYDDDETGVYGTNPDAFDTDGDGVGDGEEVYNRDTGLGGPSDPLTPDGGAAPAPAPAGCAAGLTDCGGICVDLATDNAHCGACGAGCAEYVNCGSGLCGGPTCAAGQSACGVACVDLLADQANCGSCGRACGGGEVCSGGACLATEQGGMVGLCRLEWSRVWECNGTCVNLNNDDENCGACGRSCLTGPGVSWCYLGECR